MEYCGVMKRVGYECLLVDVGLGGAHIGQSTRRKLKLRGEFCKCYKSILPILDRTTLQTCGARWHAIVGKRYGVGKDDR